MAKRIKFSVGTYVHSKKQNMTARITAVREFGGYIQRNGQPFCCPWADLTEATKGQKRDYIIAQSKVKTEQKAKLEAVFRPFQGGKPERKVHKVKPKAQHMHMLKDILEYLNLKYPFNPRVKEEKRKEYDRYPVSAVWHGIGETYTSVLNSKGDGVVLKKKKFVYGWTLVIDWMWLEDDVVFQAYLKALRKKYEPQGLKFDCVLPTHAKVMYAGLLSIRSENRPELKLGGIKK